MKGDAVSSNTEWLIEEALAFYSGDYMLDDSRWKQESWVSKIGDASERSLLKFKVSVGLGSLSMMVAGLRLLSDFHDPLFTTIAVAAPLGSVALIQHFYSDRHEPTHIELLNHAPTAEQKRRVHALREFRRLLVEGEIEAHWLSSSGTRNQIPGNMFSSDNGLVLILGIGNRDSIRPWMRKPVGPVYVKWIPQKFVSPEEEEISKDSGPRTDKEKVDCGTVLEGVLEAEFITWRDELMGPAKGKTKERLTELLNMMFEVANDGSRNLGGNAVETLHSRLKAKCEAGGRPYGKETIDKILHGPGSSKRYSYVLKYLLARKGGQRPIVERGKRGHPVVRFGPGENTP